MKPEQLQQLLDNSTTLAKSNMSLVKANHKAVQLLKESINKNEALNKVAIQIYQALNSKKQKSVLELAWHNALQEIFNKKV